MILQSGGMGIHKSFVGTWESQCENEQMLWGTSYDLLFILQQFQETIFQRGWMEYIQSLNTSLECNGRAVSIHVKWSLLYSAHLESVYVFWSTSLPLEVSVRETLTLLLFSENRSFKKLHWKVLLWWAYQSWFFFFRQVATSSHKLLQFFWSG